MDFPGPFALIGNGKTPTHATIITKLKSIQTFLCVDGGADNLIKLGYKPNILLGDLDSINKNINEYNCQIVSLKSQVKNDMEKSLEWCVKHNIEILDLIGFSGGRDDQNIANLYIMKKFSNKIKMRMYTNHSIIYCINQHINIKTKLGQTISIFSFNDSTIISTTGLKYPLKQSKLNSPSHGISNISLGDHFTIQPSDWVLVFVNHIV